jgi:pyridoxamine 5'-phosphate oxidase
MAAQPPFFIPSFYDDLDETIAEAWRVVGRGVVDRKSAFHTPCVATTGLDGAPRVRTVVLRGADRAARSLRFHTDQRSAKCAELTRDPRVGIMGYDLGRKIQVRLAGVARLHTDDDVAAAAWAKSRPMSLMCYRQIEPPGVELAHPTSLAAPSAEGYENFVVVAVTVHDLEWLYLAHDGHRRARCIWSEAGRATATWLAP